MPIIIDNAVVVTELGSKDNFSLVINDEGIISYVGPSKERPPANGFIYDLGGLYISPGFVDIHVHGGFGVTFGHGNLDEGLNRYSTWAAKNGVTNFLCSIAAPDPHSLLELIQKYVEVLSKETPGAQCSGLHLEGPFLNVERKGAFHPAWLRKPRVAEAIEYIDAGRGWIKQITIAPEIDGAHEVAELFARNGIVVALGHSNANFEIASTALRGNFTHITHTYNAQSGFNHRLPGVVGAVLTSENGTAEVIADMVHIHPEAIKVLIRCLGTDRIVLVTDAMAGAGLEDGSYQLVGQEVTVKDGIALLANGTLAGGTSTMNKCVKNMIEKTNVSLVDAIKMASLNPAKVIKESGRIGSIVEGKDASLIAVDNQLNVFLTLVKGRVVYNNL